MLSVPSKPQSHGCIPFDKMVRDPTASRCPLFQGLSAQTTKRTQTSHLINKKREMEYVTLQPSASNHFTNGKTAISQGSRSGSRNILSTAGKQSYGTDIDSRSGRTEVWGKAVYGRPSTSIVWNGTSIYSRFRRSNIRDKEGSRTPSTFQYSYGTSTNSRSRTSSIRDKKAIRTCRNDIQCLWEATARADS